MTDLVEKPVEKQKITERTLKNMKFHDIIQFGDDFRIVRVHRGWIYFVESTSTFVPEVTTKR